MAPAAPTLSLGKSNAVLLCRSSPRLTLLHAIPLRAVVACLHCCQ